MDCQADPLTIAKAMKDYFTHQRPVEAWIEGDRVFE